jgi:uncharacterized protein YdeI (YjbR/CyaY-like superfamily)
MSATTPPTEFRTHKAFEAWLRKHHRTTDELIIRLFKVHASHRGIGYRDALDIALCWGWIDGIRRSHDDDSFTQRFTPRRARSIWSAVNIRRVNELAAEGRMQEPGLAEFAKRDEERSRIYAFENRHVELSAEFQKRFKRDKVAWAHFITMAPWYRRTTVFWVMDAKKEETRVRRLTQLMDRSREGLSIPQLQQREKAKSK